ncbi:MAG: TIGR03986 family type III CRISPR-associated RAMP protein [Pseudonocardiales bacterium]
MTQFFNPYAFVPASRRRGDARPADDGPAESGGLLRADNWTGRLRLRITAVTPLLITEQDGTEQDSTQRRTRTVNGQITVQPTTVKGMIRSEFETVTKSRFGVFGDHHRHRLAHRTQTRDSASLVPVRVTTATGENGQKKRHVLPLRGVRDHRLKPMAAAWVPRYGTNPVAVPPDIRHESLVWAWVVLVRRLPAPRSRERDIFYWRVVTMADGRGKEPAEPEFIPEPPQNTKHRHVIEPDERPRLILGWYFHSNRNIGNKHDERVFFADGLEKRDRSRWPKSLPLGKDVVDGWSDLITSYHDAHSHEEIHQRKHKGRPVAATEYVGHKPGDTAWSWHLLPENDKLDELKELPDKTLCYAEIDNGRVTALYPVALSRKLYQTSPQKLAETAGLAPATQHDELSPADRVFGWAPPARGKGRPQDARALRGRVRVGPVTAGQGAATEPVERGLAILGQPRPTQDLFYAAEDPAGTPLASGNEGYRNGGGLRGRKVYPHQPGTTWSADRPQPWLLHGTGIAENRPDVGSQNALLHDWIAPGAEFQTDLHVQDLTPAELGALLYVLQGADPDGWQQRFHKMGGGKPLGFGTVTVQVLWDESDLQPGTDWQSYFALRDTPKAATHREQAERTIADFLRRSATATHERPAHLRAYEHYLSGFPEIHDPADPQVHYPADPGAPDSDENRYEWFVDNRKAGKPQRLGALERGIDGLRLPLRPGPEKQARNEPRRDGHQGRRR